MLLAEELALLGPVQDEPSRHVLDVLRGLNPLLELCNLLYLFVAVHVHTDGHPMVL